MEEYEVWMEGFSATGERSGAQFQGKIKSESFAGACEKLVGKQLDKNTDGSYRYGIPSIWGCRLFDNEKDARKSFG